ncbi:MAG: energy-coupling factor ABC transporter ATP-binding protein [Gammaproteobacteria bacterium]
MNPYSITFYNLHKCFGHRVLFDIEELTIKSGQCTLLSGINGSGKSTLLKTIAGLEQPDQVNILHNEKQLDWKSAYKNIHKEIIYLHQSPLMFDASVADNISYGMRKQGFSTTRIRRRLATALHWADLEHLRDNNARILSGGEKQRVAIARAYVLSPKVLLLDEAFSNMDSDGRQRTFEQIRKLKNEGIGIILTSHEFTQIISLTDHHLKLQDGNLVTINHKDSSRPSPYSHDALTLITVNA